MRRSLWELLQLGGLVPHVEEPHLAVEGDREHQELVLLAEELHPVHGLRVPGGHGRIEVSASPGNYFFACFS